MANFKSSVEHVSGAKIVEDGVEKDIVFLEPLIKTGETKTACYFASEVPALITTLASDVDFAGYHIATSTELTALCDMLTKQYTTTTLLHEENAQPRAYIGWKPANEIPGNITGPEYVRQVLGWPMDGYEAYDPDTDTTSRIVDGTCSSFWTADTISADIKRPLICTDEHAMSLQMLWGTSVPRTKRSILMVKNRD